MSSCFEALVLCAPGDLRYEQVPLRRCEPTEILVKIETASICNGSDRNMYLGHPRYTYPMTFGHEPFGTVVDRGSGVTDLVAGDEVSWWFSVGAFAEYCYVDITQVGIAKLSGHFDRASASLLELATATARAMWASAAKPTDRVLIIGLGPSGLILTQQLRAAGIVDVEGWELLPNRLEQGRTFGLATTFDTGAPLEELLDHVATESFDVVFDCYGNDGRADKSTADAAVAALRHGGAMIRYGHPLEERHLDPAEIDRKGIRAITPSVPLPTVRDLIGEQADAFMLGALDLGSLVSHRIPWRGIEATLLDQIENPDSYLKAVVQL